MGDDSSCLNVLSQYIQETKKYSPLSNEEQKELLRLYHEDGDACAREKLINHNQGLVLFCIRNNFKNKISQDALLEHIQNGNIGLINAIEKFDLSYENNFSTYAVWWINQSIFREKYNTGETIRKPASIKSLQSKYYRFLERYQKTHDNDPTDEEIMTALEISINELELLKTSFKASTVSISSPIKNDSDTSIEYYLADKTDLYNEKNNDIDCKILLNRIKKILNKKEYYLIYYRYCVDDKLTLEELAAEFGVTRERIRQIVEKALNKIRERIDKSNTTSLSQEVDIPERITTKAILNRFKSELSPLEYLIIYYMHFAPNRKRVEEIMMYYNISFDEIKKIYNNILDTYTFLSNPDNRGELDILLKELTEKYKTSQILDLNVVPFIPSNMHIINSFLNSFTLDSLLIEIKRWGIKLSKKQLYLLQNYYKTIDCNGVRDALKELNLFIGGYIGNKANTSIRVLRDFYNQNKNRFSESQKATIDSFFHINKNHDDVDDKDIDKFFLLEKLEHMYYGIGNLYDWDVSVNDIENTIDDSKYIFTKMQRQCAELFYGLHGNETHKIDEVADMLNSTYAIVHSSIRSVRERCLKRMLSKKTNKEYKASEKYIPILSNMQYDLTLETRKVLKMHLIEGLDYEEISKVTGLSKYRISNIVTDGIRKMDCYLLGLIKPLTFTKKELNRFYDEYANNYSSLEKEVIEYRYFKGYGNKDIASELSLDAKYINKIISVFQKRFLCFKARDVIITRDMIENELNSHISNRVLNEQELMILSYYNGIKSDYNIAGVKLSKIDIAKMLNISINSCYAISENARLKLAERKLGFYEPIHGLLTPSEIEEALKDPRVPLNNKDKEILYYLKGINGYPTLSSEMLGKKLGVNAASITRRYRRSVTTIIAYQRKEIAGLLDYEIDIVPIKKYFSLFYQNVLKLIYKDRVSPKELEEYYSITKEQALSLYNRVTNKVLLLIKEPDKTNMFDFDYARTILDKTDLPEKMNYGLIIPLYLRYFGDDGMMPMSYSELKIKYDFPYNESTFHNAMQKLLLSLVKYAKGFRSSKKLDPREIYDYYHKNESSIDHLLKEKFKRYLAHNPHFESNRNKFYVSDKKQNLDIINEIIKTRGDYITLDNISKEDLWELTTKYPLSTKSIDALSIYCGTFKKGKLSYKDQILLFRTLKPIYDAKLKGKTLAI